MKCPFSFPSGPVRLLWLAAAALTGAGLGAMTRPSKGTDIVRGLSAGSATPRPPSGQPTALALQLRALKAGTPAQQLAAALHLAELETEEEIRDLLGQAHTFPHHAAKDLAVQVLLRRWLDLNAAAALAYADLRHHGHWPGLLAAYGVSHPAEAEAYWRTIPPGKAKTTAWEGLCDGLIPRHPAEAWRLFEEDGTPSQGRMFRRLAALDVEDTLTRLGRLPPSRQEAARRVIAAELMKRDPARALAWIESQPEKRVLLAEAAAVAYRKDPTKAFAILAGLSDRDRNIALGNMQSRSDYPQFELPHAGTGQDRAALAAAVVDSPLNNTEKAGLLNRFFWQDPARGQAFWEHFDEEAQLARLPTYLYRWSALEKTAAEAWWKGLPPGALRTAAETHWQELEATWNQQGKTEAGRLLVAIRSGNYPREADSRLTGLASGDLSALVSAIPKPDYGRIAAMIHGVGASNPDVVASWLETTPVTNETLPVIAEFTARWALDDPGAAAGWVCRLPDGKMAATAAFNIARQYQVYDPEGAQQWMEGLVEKTVQEAARKGLMADREMDSE